MINFRAIERHPFVEAVTLFGSRARGDSDEFSDMDLAVFVKATHFMALGEIKSRLMNIPSDEEFSLSLYSTRTAEILAREGSLFLWHLNLEGKVLFERNKWISLLFSRLAPYELSKALRDLKTFENILNDVNAALGLGDSTLLFEAATMYAVLRNSAMIHTYTKGAPCFGRSEPIKRLAQDMGQGFPFTSSEIRTLQLLRLTYTRIPSLCTEYLSSEWCKAMLRNVQIATSFVRERLYA